MRHQYEILRSLFGRRSFCGKPVVEREMLAVFSDCFHRSPIWPCLFKKEKNPGRRGSKGEVNLPNYMAPPRIKKLGGKGAPPSSLAYRLRHLRATFSPFS